ncbi:DUF6916 family protein [Halopseudomonas salegens]|uniref:DUF6916 domain-containing protein n=1 Tax=Halopseudomonas salegens TaxID=1434072 RepID=A0A1H2EP60_9GAMM|nr:hypothetical protein [Halopseudomonas salegens]SDT96906.1 hypothetical protein SAMN05216210_0916 [Halopseudomonas salegens]
MLEKLSSNTFEPLRGQAFQLQHDALSSDAQATLVEVRQASQDHSGPSGRPPFSLLFACPQLDQAFQSLFTLKHDTTGELDVFLVAVGQDERGLLLEAVFT